MKVLINQDLSRHEWSNFVRSSAFSSPFQTPEYFDFFNSIPNLSAEVFAIEDNGELRVLCVITIQKEAGLKGFFSRRAIIYGGPIIEEGANISLRLLLNEIQTHLKKKVIYIETRNLYDYSKYLPEFEQAGWKYSPHLNYHLNCETKELVWSNLNSNRKRQIKKAFKNGVEIIEATELSEVTTFYEILKELYHKKVHKPLMPRQFFEYFFIRKLGKFLLVKYHDKIIGGIMCPVLKDNIIYEWYIAGLDSEYKDESPSVMATYAAISYAFNNRLSKFDFMGAGKPEEEYGVRDFKAKFGGQVIENGRFIKTLNPLLFNIGKIGLKGLSKIKK